jgi:acyl carrier protein
VGRVHLRKHLEGKKSGHLHEIDIVIETTVAQLDILILLECKHYSRTVDVGDILTFASRIDDIGAHKGVMVSTKGFQEGTKKVARAHGIALVVTEPIWQTILASSDGNGSIQAFTTGGIYIGGDSSKDLFLGTTAVASNYPANMRRHNAEAWSEILFCLSAECDAAEKTKYLHKFLKSQCSHVCPFCGEELRTPTAQQCESCCMDWHDVEHPVRRIDEAGSRTSEVTNLFNRLVELVANKFSVDKKWIGLSTDLAADLGADHIDFIELLLAIEHYFEMTFGDDFNENESYKLGRIYGYLIARVPTGCGQPVANPGAPAA